MRMFLLLVGLSLGVLLALCSGCSTHGGVDFFYPKQLEPRQQMPWYISHDRENSNGFKGMSSR